MKVHEHVENWISEISVPRSVLKNFAVCPFAKTAKYKIIELTTLNGFVPFSFVDSNLELILYVLPVECTIEELEKFVAESNHIFNDYVFIPDHKDKKTFIKNVQTNNGKFNLVFCQPKEKMIKARTYLWKIGYYTNWTTEQMTQMFDSFFWKNFYEKTLKKSELFKKVRQKFNIKRQTSNTKYFF